MSRRTGMLVGFDGAWNRSVGDAGAGGGGGRWFTIWGTVERVATSNSGTDEGGGRRTGPNRRVRTRSIRFSRSTRFKLMAIVATV